MTQPQYESTTPPASAQPDSQARASVGEKAGEHMQAAAAFWADSEHRDLLFYLAVAIFFLELVVGAVAFFYGVMHATPGVHGGPPRFQFPWLAYALAAVLVPAALLLIVHLAGVGLFRSLRSQEESAVWQQNLPERLRKVYAIIQGAPTVVLLIGILTLGVALFYIDGAVGALLRLGTTLEPYLPWIIGAVAVVLCVGMLGRVWLHYRSKRLEEEFRFRMEVLERTGVIIVERGSMQLAPPTTEPQRALSAGGIIELNPALGNVQNTEADTPQGPIVDVK